MIFSEKLKQNTAPLHDKVDQLVSQMIKSNDPSLPVSFSMWYDLLRQSGLTTQKPDKFDTDLSMDEISSSLPEKPEEALPSETFVLQNEKEWLGAYYVIRGSANGSKYLIKMLEKDHALYKYFAYLAGLPDEHWVNLKATLDNTLPNEQQSILMGAEKAFTSLLFILEHKTLSIDIEKS